MFPLAFDAGWLQGHWWGFISRNYVVWPTFLLMNVFIALAGRGRCQLILFFFVGSSEDMRSCNNFIQLIILYVSAFALQAETKSRKYFTCDLIIKIEPGHEKMCLMSYAHNKGADQPAHPRSLISAFVVRCLGSVISLDSIAAISRL